LTFLIKRAILLHYVFLKTDNKKEEKMKNMVGIAIMVVIGVISFGTDQLNTATIQPETATVRLENLSREQVVQIAHVAILSMESETEVKRRQMDYQIAVFLLETEPENELAQAEVNHRIGLLKRAVVIDELRSQNYLSCLNSPLDCAPLDIVSVPTEQEIREVLEMFFKNMTEQQEEENRSQGNFSAPFSPSHNNEYMQL
jgi:hypothetical protein